MKGNAMPAPLETTSESNRSGFLHRLLKSDQNAVSDVELLELLLAPIIPDAHGMAIRLLERFTTLANVMRADEQELKSVGDVDDGIVQMLCCAWTLGERVLRNEIMERPVIDCWAKLIKYCTLTMAHEKVETFRVLFLNHAHRLIADEVQHRGTVNHTPVYPREVVRRALELSAAAVILVHNHPSCDPTPSPSDIEMTNRIVAAGNTMGITVHDHIVISEEGHFSFLAQGLLNKT